MKHVATSLHRGAIHRADLEAVPTRPLERQEAPALKVGIGPSGKAPVDEAKGTVELAQDLAAATAALGGLSKSLDALLAAAPRGFSPASLDPAAVALGLAELLIASGETPTALLGRLSQAAAKLSQSAEAQGQLSDAPAAQALGALQAALRSKLSASSTAALSPPEAEPSTALKAAVTQIVSLLGAPTGAALLDLHLEAFISALSQKSAPGVNRPAGANAALNAYVVDGSVGAPGALALEALKTASLFSVRMEGPKADDSLVAAGVAIARGVPSLYVVPERKQLPWFLREADQTYPGTVKILEQPSAGAIEQQLRAEKQALFGARAALPPASGEPTTFIGCLMSGLSESQYTEGRSHLMAIDEALRTQLGAKKTHCEGIMVASTNSFGTPKESLAMDVEAIRNSDRCVFYLFDGEPRPSGMWVEAGVALGLEKPCTFLVPSEDALPPCLKAGARPEQIRVVVYESHDALKAGLGSDAQAWIG